MGLDRGCNYCKKLKCTEEPLLEFECIENPNLKLKNAGACFVSILDIGTVIIRNCPNFEKGSPDFISKFD